MEKPAVLVAIDLPVDVRQLDPVVELALATGWQIDLLHVSGPGETSSGNRAEAVADELRGSGPAVTAHTIAGPTVETILSCAEEWQSKMIVVVGHKHHLAHRVALGSVESTLLKVATQSVLVLPPTEEGQIAQFPADGLGTATDRLIEILERTQTDGEFEDLRTAARAQRQEPESQDQKERLGGRMQEILERFETDHPSVTRAINDVAYYLSGMGL